jgi:predicted nucleic acid-binding protein
LQETSFVLAKLGMDSFQIAENMLGIERLAKTNYSVDNFQRAKFLALKIGFQNINDCLHLAIAEQYCKELYTFNKNDFEKLKPHTNLKLTIF